MKKKWITCAISLAMAFAMLFSLVGCFGGGSDDDGDKNAPKTYTIQYADDAGAHQLTVTAGMPYSLEVVPVRNGYNFVGLFDAETGGTQYVSASGASLSPFTDGKNMVLFPRFTAKEYTVILDYQGAPVTGSRQLSVAYGSSLPELPKNLTGEHKTFAGWYTEANCEGVQVADEYGLVPLVSVLNETNFDLSKNSITLYAGFEIETFTVTCCFEAGTEPEQMKVAYDTPVSQIVPETRIDGKAPLTWSKSEGGEVFNGKITDDTVLYAVEYAPVINLDVNGGNKVNSIVARAGSTVALPTPTKDLAKFSHWEDMQGNKYTATTMPENSISLKAVWQAKLVFDENGGSDVEDISVKAGEKVTLPTPSRENFIFAGWFTADKEKYTSATMPAAGIKLKAGWYAAKTKVIGSGTKEGYTGVLDPNAESKQSADWRNEFDLSDILPATGGNIHIKLTYKVRLRDGNGGIIRFGDYFYDGAIIGDSYVLGSQFVEVNTTAEREVSFEADLAMKSNTLYVAHYGKNIGTKYERAYFVRVSLEITYGDTANLYL